jgi:GST-like protein
MSIMPWLRFPERQGVNIEEYPNLKEWRDRIAARPAVKKALEVLGRPQARDAVASARNSRGALLARRSMPDASS